MLDYQRIVDDVRSCLFSNSLESVDFLRSAAADYSVACDEVNERLRRCGALLRQGLRSEAIQLADIEPILLDLVATLDFPERRQWEEIAQFYGIVPPPPLLYDVAADLNEAYAIEQPLAELLRQHRLLALARGPLKNRINTLRSLIQADTNNPVWQEDLPIFEAERLKELQREAAEAMQAGDLATIAAVDDELRVDGWSSLPPAALVKSTSSARRKLEERDARAHLERVAFALHEAHAAFDIDAAQQRREQWKVAAAGIVPIQDDPYFEMANSALKWLAEQEQIAINDAQHGAAVAKLEGGLAGRAEADELRRRHKAAVAHGYKLSADLETRYRNRLDQLARAVRRRRLAIVAGISATILLAAAAVFCGIRTYRFNQDVAVQNDALAALLDGGDLGAAKTFVTRLKANSPAVADSDELQTLERRLETSLQKEADRHKSFEGFLQAAQAHGPENPDNEALQTATTLAKNDAERLEIQQFKEAIAAADRSAADRRSATFTAALAPFNARLKTLKALRGDPKLTQAEIDRFRSDLKNLETQTGDVSAEAKSHEDALLSALETVQAELKQRLEEDRQLIAVTAAVGNPEAFKDELTHYTQRFPDSPRGADFKRSLESFSLWVGVAKWNELLTAFGQKEITRLDPAAAKDLLVKTKAVLDKYDDYPEADAIRSRMAYLESITRRVDSDQQRIDEPLKRLFGDALVAHLWMVKIKDGPTYYLKDPPPADLAISKAAGISYLTGFDLVEKSVGIRVGTVVYKDEAPQVALAKEVRPMIKRLDDTNWEPIFCQIAKAVAESQDVDPILKVNLMRQSLETGSRGSSVFEHAFSKQVDKLAEQNVNPFANWLDPKDPDAPNQRRRAETALDKFPDVAAATAETEKELAKLRRSPGKIRRWIGWLRRSPTGEWRCEPTALGDQSGELFVVVRNGIGERIKFERVGALKDGVAALEIPAAGGRTEGSPVYLVAP